MNDGRPDHAELAKRILEHLTNEPVDEREPFLAANDELVTEVMARLLSQDQRWDGELDELADALAEALHSLPPERWNVLLKGLSLFFRAGDVPDDHPRAAEGRVHTLPDGRTVRRVDLGLARRAIAQLVERASESARIEMFAALDDWTVFRIVGEILAPVRLSPWELGAVLARAVDFTRRDMAAGYVLEPIRAWAEAHPEIAIEVVDAWRRDDERVSGLDSFGVQLLVEAALKTTPERIEWRDELIAELERFPDPERWALAAQLACFARPDAARGDVGVRLAEARERASAHPAELMLVGFAIHAREASEFPDAAIDSALALLRDAPAFARRGREAEWAAELGGVALQALLARKQTGQGVDSLALVLPQLEAVPLNRARGLDFLLGELARVTPADVSLFLESWLVRNGAEIQESPRAFDELVPHVAEALGYSGVQALLTGWLAAPDAGLRYVATLLVSGQVVMRNRFDLAEDIVRSWSTDQARGVAWELVGLGVLSGETWIPLLLHVAQTRPDARDDILSVLQTNGLDDYPAALDRALRESDGQGSDEELSNDEWAAMCQRLRSSLAARTASIGRSHAVPEVRYTRPTASIWHELQSESFEASLDDRRDSDRFPLLSMVQEVPIVCGGAAHVGGSIDRAVPFGRFEGSVELPGRETFDPLGRRWRRAHLRLQAARWLSTPAMTEDES